MEIFLEPRLPAPVLAVAGDTPIADAIAVLAPPLGFVVKRATRLADTYVGATALIVSSHGRHEPEAIRFALDAGVGFVGLVASRVRGEAVLEDLELNESEQRFVHTPVGLEIGARTAEEIALSIMAELVKSIRVDGLKPPVFEASSTRIIEAKDPVCGMTVVVGPDTPHLHAEGADHWFCNPGCRTRYAEEIGAEI